MTKLYHKAPRLTQDYMILSAHAFAERQKMIDDLRASEQRFLATFGQRHDRSQYHGTGHGAFDCPENYGAVLETAYPIADSSSPLPT